MKFLQMTSRDGTKTFKFYKIPVIQILIAQLINGVGTPYPVTMHHVILNQRETQGFNKSRLHPPHPPLVETSRLHITTSARSATSATTRLAPMDNAIAWQNLLHYNSVYRFVGSIFQKNNTSNAQFIKT